MKKAENRTRKTDTLEKETGRHKIVQKEDGKEKGTKKNIAGHIRTSTHTYCFRNDS
jgi:hypothetical protein